MGNKPKFDDMEIVRAGIALRDAGEAINGWSLRTKLGGGKTDRLLAVWQASPEGRREAAKAVRGRIDPAAITRVMAFIEIASRKALAELDAEVSSQANARDLAHAERLAEAVKWAEGQEERTAEQVRTWSEDVRAATARAERAEAELAVVPILRGEIADLRSALDAARAAEAAVRAELSAVQSSRDEMVARLREAEDRERQAVERAARAEGAVAALAANRPPAPARGADSREVHRAAS